MKYLLQSWAMIVFMLLGGTAISAEPAVEQNSAYQSTLKNYQPLQDESLADWKALNQQAQSGGHAGHNMKPGTGSSDMDHGNMDHTTMDHGAMDQKVMDHGAMDHSAMGHAAPAPEKATAKVLKPENAAASVKSMDHSAHAPRPPSTRTDPVHDHAGHEHTAPADLPIKEPLSNEVSRAEIVPAHESPEEMNHGHAESMEKPDPLATEDGEHANTAKPAKAKVVKFEIIPNLHAVAVHFPIAFTLLAFIFHLLAYDRKGHQNSAMLAAAGHYTLWIAAVSAVITAFLGWQAFNSIANHDDAGHAAMLLHRAWAIPTAIILALLASWDAWKYKVTELISVPMVIVLFLLTQAIAVTAWLGGEVVYRHGIGVLSMPSSAEATHDHTAGGQHAH
jgi:uncharacterized membrane protein